jgi:hypothetical protein
MLARDENAFQSRLGEAAQLKRRLGARVATMLAEGETVFVDCSTTAFYAVRSLLESGKTATVATPSVPVMDGERDPRQHGQRRRGAAGLAHLGLELARGARGRLRDRRRRPRAALPQADDAGRQHPAERHRRGRDALRVWYEIG